MGTLRRILTLLGILIVGVPGVAAADWQLAPFLGLTFKGSTTFIDNEGGAAVTHWSLGAAVALSGAGPVGVEGIVMYTPGFFQNESPSLVPDPPSTVDSRLFTMMGNVVCTTPRSWNEYGLRPFISGGLGMLYASSTDRRSIQEIRKWLPGYNVGGGATGFLTERVGLRFELRRFSTLRAVEPSSGEAISIGAITLKFWAAHVGVVLKY